MVPTEPQSDWQLLHTLTDLTLFLERYGSSVMSECLTVTLHANRTHSCTTFQDTVPVGPQSA